MPSAQSDLALRGRLGAYTTHSRHDVRETTKAARSAFLLRFEREVDPEGTLPLAERQRRAEAARKAYFVRLALSSARARSKRARRLKDRPQEPNRRPTEVGQATTKGGQG